MDIREAIIWLYTCCGVGVGKIAGLLEFFGSFEEIYNCKHFTTEMGITQGIADELNNRNLDRMKKIMEYCNKNNIQMIPYNSEKYPKQLFKCKDFPYILYVKGKAPELIYSVSVSVVGSRTPSGYGINATTEIVKNLAKYKVPIVSGMAYGIDAVAHKAALDNDCPTVAVLGTGVDVVYPRENKSIYDKIFATGAIVSEYPPGSPASRYSFPQRNRIISGLSKIVLVVEGAEKSGTSITARLAKEQGNEVFAVPGSIFSEKSFTPNKLIKEGAHIVSTANELMSYLLESGIYSEKSSIKYENNEVKINLDLDEKEKAVYNCLNYEEEISMQKIMEKSGLSVIELGSTLTMMEIKNYISQKPGRMYIKKI